MTTKLQNKMMIASLGMSRWGNRKRDKKATDSISASNHTLPNMVAVNKKLINPRHLKEINKVYSAARLAHDNMTAPWQNQNGARVLPSKTLMDWMSIMRGFKREFNEAVDNFMEVYEIGIDNAKAELGAMFNNTEYPTVDVMRSKFNFKTSILPIPDAGDFRIDIPVAELAEITSDMTKSLNEAQDAITSNLIYRATTTLEELHKVLLDEDRKLFKTTVESNISTLSMQLETLNYNDDKAISALGDYVKESLIGLSADTIKKNHTYRKEAVAKVEAAINLIPQ